MRRRNLSLAVFVTLVYLFLFTPIVAVVLLSFGQNVSVLTLQNLSLQWYARVIRNDQVLRALWFSVQIGVLASGLAVVVGTLAAFGLVRGSFRGKAALQAALFSPMIVPEIILAVALLALFVLLRIPRGYVALVVGHTLLILPYVVSIVGARLYGFDRSLEEAAMNLGARPIRTMVEVTLPLMAPAIICAALIAFKVSFDEVVGSMFWSSVRDQTLPVVVFAMLNWDLTPQVNAIGTIMVAVTLCLLGAYQLAEMQQRRRR
jgi:spermidine/putrescine transport system permease protein